MKRSRGDTLIEVMIALAIISSVIAVSYATASKALLVGRAAQERTEALKLLEGQIETLKANAAGSGGSIFTTSSASFCLRSDGSIVEQSSVPDDLFADNLTTSADSSTPVGPGITYDFNCALGTDGRYKISIVRSDSGSGSSLRNIFTLRARWDRLGGGKDEVKIYYKLHEVLY
ncbi:type II secretion system protein [Candidatus Saccharibacteria bacterium]|nr:type II secretion system protein [Candidatus Saccharibacteria bacterium]